jgi:hypothetical protein
MTTKKPKKNLHNFYCEKCDFKCFSNTDWNRHITRAKHIKTINNNGKNLENLTPKYVCNNCEKKYNDRSGLWRHKKKCLEKEDTTIVQHENSITPELVIEIIKQNQELQKQNQELQKQNNELQKQNNELQKQNNELQK